jgi:hypothetical protein
MRAYWPLRILCLLFLAPFLGALLLHLNKADYQLKTVQHGTFVQPAQKLQLRTRYNLNDIELSPLLEPNKWHVIYLSPQICDGSCQQQKQILGKIHTALGADRERVIVATTPSSMLSSEQKGANILIIDPLGFNIMRYEANFKAKDLVKDLKRLLKYSHAK